MNLENIGKKELMEKVRILLQVIVDDLKNLKKPSVAGWRKLSDLKESGISEEDLTELSRLGVLEKNLTEQIRIRYKDNRIRKRFKFSFDIQFRQIDYFIESQNMFKQDTERVQRAKKIIQQIISNAKKNKNFLSNAIAIGIWRMLNASDMPAAVDEILSKGFSPQDWGIISIRSASYFSVELTRKVGRIKKLDDALNYMKTSGFINEIPNLAKLNTDEVLKVKEVLRWQKICETLSEEDVKFFSISWFVVFILEENDALPSYIDFSTKIVDLIKSGVENIMNEEYSNLADKLTTSINALEEQHGITWASNIIFLPEVL